MNIINEMFIFGASIASKQTNKDARLIETAMGGLPE